MVCYDYSLLIIMKMNQLFLFSLNFWRFLTWFYSFCFITEVIKQLLYMSVWTYTTYCRLFFSIYFSLFTLFSCEKFGLKNTKHVYVCTHTVVILRTMSKYGRVMCNERTCTLRTLVIALCARSNATKAYEKKVYKYKLRTLSRLSRTVVNSLAITSGTSYTHQNILAYALEFMWVHKCECVRESIICFYHGGYSLPLR